MDKLIKVKSKLEDFEEGDLIHRICPINHALIKEDRSYIESPIRFLGCASNLFFFQNVNESILDYIEIRTSEIAFWDDGNWRLFPISFLQRLKGKYLSKK